eukprot:CAMPEP_0181287928 /NCGR_PEP_ID=MMETSP1101-20121128/55_1 /TAXON_ID=46948 /ORGANISM="Rhodomonas abbreviata, Strain Caron Lab Isolate" /LENGTH=516 /DNA_ID=CAMNT_0023392005 /DNA_START=214 /DNA_END=1761 /DNA_ORIENTATION=+
MAGSLNKTLCLLLNSLLVGVILGVFATLATIAFVMNMHGRQALPFQQQSYVVLPDVAASPMHSVEFEKQNIFSDLRDAPTEVGVSISSDVPRADAKEEAVINRVGEAGGQPINPTIHPARQESHDEVASEHLSTPVEHPARQENHDEVADGVGKGDTQPIDPIIHTPTPEHSSNKEGIVFPQCDNTLANDPLAIQRLIPDHPGELTRLKNSCFQRTGGDKNVVFIWSHRRSGTHAAISLILENFENIDIIKTGHYVPDESFKGGCQNLRLWQTLGHQLYVFRDPLDTMVSLRSFARHLSMEVEDGGDFLWEDNDFPLRVSGSMDRAYVESLDSMNRLEFWKYHISSAATQPNTAFLSFQNIVEDPEYAVATLETLFGWKRRSTQKVRKPKNRRDSVYYRGGKSDGFNEFQEGDISEAWKVLQQPVNLDYVLKCENFPPATLPGTVSVKSALERIVRSSRDIAGYPADHFPSRSGMIDSHRLKRPTKKKPPTSSVSVKDPRFATQQYLDSARPPPPP